MAKSVGDVVRGKYPKAVIKYFAPIRRDGQREPISPASWAVYPSDAPDQEPIGRGDTALEAWNAAAKVIRAESPPPPPFQIPKKWKWQK